MAIHTQTDPESGERERPNAAVQRVLWITLGLNLLVAFAKIFFGYRADIVSLQADGFHSIFDGASNVIGLVALGLAAKPPDPEHPYGHRKIEVAASFSIGLMVLLGLLEVGRGRLTEGAFERLQIAVGDRVVLSDEIRRRLALSLPRR